MHDKKWWASSSRKWNYAYYIELIISLHSWAQNLNSLFIKIYSFACCLKKQTNKKQISTYMYDWIFLQKNGAFLKEWGGGTFILNLDKQKKNKKQKIQQICQFLIF